MTADCQFLAQIPRNCCFDRQFEMLWNEVGGVETNNSPDSTSLEFNPL